MKRKLIGKAVVIVICMLMLGIVIPTTAAEQPVVDQDWGSVAIGFFKGTLDRVQFFPESRNMKFSGRGQDLWFIGFTITYHGPIRPSIKFVVFHEIDSYRNLIFENFFVGLRIFKPDGTANINGFGMVDPI